MIWAVMSMHFWPFSVCLQTCAPYALHRIARCGLQSSQPRTRIMHVSSSVRFSIYRFCPISHAFDPRCSCGGRQIVQSRHNQLRAPRQNQPGRPQRRYSHLRLPKSWQTWAAARKQALSRVLADQQMLR